MVPAPGIAGEGTPGSAVSVCYIIDPYGRVR
jgi:hypothetical protein